MKVVYSPDHQAHDLTTGVWVGVAIDGDELPMRVEVIKEILKQRGHQVVPAQSHDDSTLRRVHDPAMVDYMAKAYAGWVEAGYAEMVGQQLVTGYAFPTERVMHGLPLRLPRSRAALAGVWAMDTMTQVGEGTYLGARAAVDVAQTAAGLVLDGASAAYGACRPPGHHAGRSFFGGSCYLNNAAVAAETLVVGGAQRVAIIDLDAHHGNGTQEIFYERGDVFYGSVHIDPGEGWFPHFVGFADERGRGPGEGANLNVPLAPGVGDEGWLEGVSRLAEATRRFGPEAIVVSLGVDAAVDDENSPLLVTGDGYRKAGEMIAALELGTVLIQEGGYHLPTLGDLVAETLAGFENHGDMHES